MINCYSYIYMYGREAMTNTREIWFPLKIAYEASQIIFCMFEEINEKLDKSWLVNFVHCYVTR